jgi:hypothetical protein
MNFDLLVEPAGPDEHRVRVLGSPAGASQPIPAVLPFTGGDVDDLLRYIGPLRPNTAWPGDEEHVAVRRLGGRLFDAVFQDEVRYLLTASLQQASIRDAELRLQLRLGAAPELTDLPWEFLYDTDARRFVALLGRTSLVRLVDRPGRVGPLPVQLPLRILVVLVGSRATDLELEWSRLQGSLADLQRSGEVQLDRTIGRTFGALVDQLSRGSYHVVHYVGEVGHDPRTGDGLVLFEDPGGRLQPVSGADLGALLRGYPSLGVALLDSVGSAGRGRGIPSASARSLLGQGVPAVVAMQFGMTHRAGTTFPREFYGSLALGRPLDDVVGDARRAISQQSGPLDWAAPTLHLGASGGDVFDIAGAVRSAAPHVSVAYGPRPGGAEPSLMDEDVQFTVVRPRSLTVGRSARLLVLAHKGGQFVDPVRGLVDPLEEVEQRTRLYFRDTPRADTRVDARFGLVRGTTLTVVPELPGVFCNPPSAEFMWWEEVHEASFWLVPGAHLTGRMARGTVRIWCGPLIVGELPVAVAVVPPGTEPANIQAVPLSGPAVNRYRRIFPSYSRLDREMVSYLATAARALGDQYLQDVLVLRAGEPWSDRILELIGDADIFQLFWSRNSMRSPSCRLEWERALSLRRPEFMRPVYWEDPLPEDHVLGLPPENLRALHFHQVPWDPAGRTTRPVPGDQHLSSSTATPSPPPVAARPPPPAPASAASAEAPPVRRFPETYPPMSSRPAWGLAAALVVLVVVLVVGTLVYLSLR